MLDASVDIRESPDDQSCRYRCRPRDSQPARTASGSFVFDDARHGFSPFNSAGYTPLNAFMPFARGADEASDLGLDLVVTAWQVPEPQMLPLLSAGAGALWLAVALSRRRSVQRA